ncbi:hypothetical protein DH2020_044163 [Rehmannia glutinosa]|uniref:Retrovirus-related Pol polyprotein from transposon TNT 1-94 n=1 Tax=Rehmannia glutinosa TaxID=99300 RepID=A0ABR0UHY2_REHGL
MMEGSLVHDHILEIVALIKRIESLGVVMDNEFYMDLVLQSLPLFDTFVLNFNMHKMETNLVELVNMLNIAKFNMKKEKHGLLVGSSSQSKAKKLKKGKKKGSSKKVKHLKATNCAHLRIDGDDKKQGAE